MDEHDEIWQRRIRELYTNIEELYSHVDITVVFFDRELVEVAAGTGQPPNKLGQPLADIARRVLDTGMPEHDVALDRTGRLRVHGFPVRDHSSTYGVACIVDDDGARRELFVRCAMALFDGYRQNEAALLERERRALEEARRANQLRDQFLAVVAHELRAPISSILLWEQVLRSPELDVESQSSALDAVHAGATGLGLLVDDLLDVSRAINGKLHIERRLTPIARVLAMAIETARPQANKRALDVVDDIDPALGHVLGDPRRLRQIFDNLLSNAIKCSEQGQISIRARQTDDTITIDVCDTGRGIASTFLPHVFEPFRQGDNEAAANEGLGLGLAIARQLVELHDGTLSAASEGPGQGAQFTVTLPRTRTRGPVDSSARPSVAGVRVLVVDDDPLLLDAFKFLFRQLRAIVTTASSAAAAYPVLQQGDIDLVLSDIGMADEDGCSFVRRIRADPGAMRLLPIIAVTARATDRSRELALAAGFDRYLTKPIDFNVLLATITELLHR